MEYEASFKFLEEQCTCCICLERFRDPLCLPCQHSCCRGCLEKILILGRNRNPSRINCPICRKVCVLKGNMSLLSLHADDNLKEKLDILEAMVPDTKPRPVEKCQACRGSTKQGAEFRCLSCDKLYCPSCLQDKNLKDLAHKDHHVAVLQRTESGKNVMLCGDHKLCFRYFCRAPACKKFVCAECCMTRHKTHDTVLVKDARAEIEAEVRIAHEQARKKSAVTANSLKKCKNSTKKFDDEGVRLRNQIRSEKRKIVSMVLFTLNKVEEEYMQIFDNQARYFKNVLESKFVTTESQHATVTTWKDKLEDMLKLQDDVEFLVRSEHAKQHFDDINSIIVDESAGPIHNLDYKAEILDAGLSSALLKNISESMGSLQLKGSKNRAKWKTHQVEICSRDLSEARLQDGSLLAQQLKQLELLPLNPEPFDQNSKPMEIDSMASGSGASKSISSTVTNSSFSDAVQGNVQRNQSSGTASNGVSAPATNWMSMSSSSTSSSMSGRSNLMSSNSSSLSNISAHSVSPRGGATRSFGRNAANSMHGSLSASAVDVRTQQNNQNPLRSARHQDGGNQIERFAAGSRYLSLQMDSTGCTGREFDSAGYTGLVWR